MSNGDGSVLFLACRVPQLRLDSGSVLHADVLRSELHSDGRALRLGQRVAQVSTQQTSLAHRDIPDEND